MSGTVVVVVAAILASIGIAIYFYDLYQPKFIHADAGDPIQVGPPSST